MEDTSIFPIVVQGAYIASSSGSTWKFPTAFTVACFGVTLGRINSRAEVSPDITSYSKTSVTWIMRGQDNHTGGTGAFLLAIGR